MLGVKTILTYAAVVLALVVSTGTSEDITEPEAEELELANENELMDLEPDYQELLMNLQRARSNAGEQELDEKRMAASGWKRAQGAAGWKRAQSAAGWKRPASAAAGWKRGQAAAAGWKRAKGASGWKRDNPIDVDTRGGENWRHNEKTASSGWKRTARSATRQQRVDNTYQLP